MSQEKEDFMKQMLKASGELQLNEDHKLLTRNAELEARLQDIFAKTMREIQSFEYSLGGYAAMPYGKTDPEKVIEQARNNQEMYKKLKSIAYRRMEELKQVIDETFCPTEYRKEGEVRKGPESHPAQSPAEMEVTISSEEPEDAYYSKKTKKKKKKYESKKNNAKTILEMALKDLEGVDFEQDSAEKIAKTYVKKARERGLDDKKIVQGLGATFRGKEDKEKADQVKQAIKKEVGFEPKPKKKKKKKEEE